MSDRELQARTALFEYYRSLMQDYKIYVVTLALSILTVVDIWSRINITTSEGFLLLLLLSAIGSAIIICIVRFLWCGQIVTSAINAPKPPAPTMRSLDKHIKKHAYDSKWGNLIQYADCKIALFIAFMIILVLLFLMLQWVIPLLRP
jgi:hypothetical protein